MPLIPISDILYLTRTNLLSNSQITYLFYPLVRIMTMQVSASSLLSTIAF